MHTCGSQTNNYRPHTEYDGKVMFSVCLFTGGAPQLGGRPGGFSRDSAAMENDISSSKVCSVNRYGKLMSYSKCILSFFTPFAICAK